MISALKSLISLQIMKKSSINEYSDQGQHPKFMHKPMIGENMQLVKDEPVEFKK